MSIYCRSFSLIVRPINIQDFYYSDYNDHCLVGHSQQNRKTLRLLSDCWEGKSDLQGSILFEHLAAKQTRYLYVELHSVLLNMYL